MDNSTLPPLGKPLREEQVAALTQFWNWKIARILEIVWKQGRLLDRHVDEIKSVCNNEPVGTLMPDAAEMTRQIERQYGRIVNDADVMIIFEQYGQHGRANEVITINRDIPTAQPARPPELNLTAPGPLDPHALCAIMTVAGWRAAAVIDRFWHLRNSRLLSIITSAFDAEKTLGDDDVFHQVARLYAYEIVDDTDESYALVNTAGDRLSFTRSETLMKCKVVPAAAGQIPIGDEHRQRLHAELGVMEPEVKPTLALATKEPSNGQSTSEVEANKVVRPSRVYLDPNKVTARLGKPDETLLPSGAFRSAADTELVVRLKHLLGDDAASRIIPLFGMIPPKEFARLIQPLLPTSEEENKPWSPADLHPLTTMQRERLVQEVLEACGFEEAANSYSLHLLHHKNKSLFVWVVILVTLLTGMVGTVVMGHALNPAPTPTPPSSPATKPAVPPTPEVPKPEPPPKFPVANDGPLVLPPGVRTLLCEAASDGGYDLQIPLTVNDNKPHLRYRIPRDVDVEIEPKVELVDQAGPLFVEASLSSVSERRRVCVKIWLRTNDKRPDLLKQVRPLLLEAD